MDERHEWDDVAHGRSVLRYRDTEAFLGDGRQERPLGAGERILAREILRLAGRVKELEIKVEACTLDERDTLEAERDRAVARVKELETKRAKDEAEIESARTLGAELERRLTLAEALAEQRRLEARAFELALFKCRNRSLLEEREAVLEAAVKPWLDEVQSLKAELEKADKSAAEAKGQTAVYLDRWQAAQRDFERLSRDLEHAHDSIRTLGQQAKSGWREAAEYARLLGAANARIEELLEENSRRPGHRKEVAALGELLGYLVKRWAEDGHGGYYVPMQGWCGNMVQLLYGRLCAALPANGQAIAGERPEPGAQADYPEGHPLRQPVKDGFSAVDRYPLPGTEGEG